MNTNLRRVLVGIPVAALAAAGIGIAATGCASAQTLPDHSVPISMTVVNNTPSTLHLKSRNLEDGSWLVGPQSELAPGASEVVTAHGDHADFTYSVTPDVNATFVADNMANGANTLGTRLDGANAEHINLSDHYVANSDGITATYTLVGH